MTDPAAAFRRYTSSREASDLQRGLANLAADGELDRAGLDDLLAQLKIDEIGDRKVELLDLLFYYIRLALADHELTSEEMATVRNLKRLFRIEEGDFMAHGPEEVGELLAVQMGRILADERVDSSEAVHKVRLQEVFDLGYDDFISLTRPFVKQVVAGWWEQGSGDWYIGDFEERIAELDTVFSMGDFLGEEVTGPLLEEIERYAAELKQEGARRSRHISQEVKDLVWRRDQGRCVECGSNEHLEFDHIIPFAKGGANTYRNVQLLCEPCNRGKADRIGESA